MLLFCDSFDHYSTLSEKWNVIDPPRVAITATGRASTSAAVFTSNGTGASCSLNRGVSNVKTVFTGFAYKLTHSGTWSGNLHVVSFFDVGTKQIQLECTTDGYLQARRGTTLLATSSRTISWDYWTYIECKVVIDASALIGKCIVRVNNEEWINFTGVTKVSANAYVSTIYYGFNYDSAAADLIARYDDLYICDDSGSYNTDFLGDVRVQAIFPNAAGTTTQWSTSGSANNWQNVDETPPNTTDYNYSSTAGNKDTYNMGSVTPLDGTVKAVQVSTYARKDDAGPRAIHNVVRHGGSEGESADLAVLDNYKILTSVHETNPSTTSPWTIDEVNAMEAGVKVQS